MATLPLDEFREWLEFQEPGSIVGDAHEPESCPIASFLWHQRGARSLNVHTHFARFRTDSGMKSIGLPAWARRFVRALDDRFSDVGVTREEALEVLAVATSKGGAS